MLIASATPDLGRGDRIEVLRKEEKDYSIWYPAVVLHSSLARYQRNIMYVEFETLVTPGDDQGGPLTEYVGVSEVRPAPPVELHRFFKVGEMVEAFHEVKKGWRKGKILDILENSKYKVLFVDDANGGSEKDVEEVMQWGLRVYRVWEDGSWLPPPIQLQVRHLLINCIMSRRIDLWTIFFIVLKN